MVDQVMGSESELSAIVPEIWSKNYYDVLIAELPFASIVARDWEGEIQDLGDTVNISSFPEFDEGDDLAEDEKADAKAITVSGQQLVINNRVVKDFIITKKALLQSLPAMDKLKQLAVYAIMKRVNTKIIAAIAPSASAPDHDVPFASSTTLALADLLEVKELLDDQNVPGADRHMVLGSAQTNDIFNISGFTSSDYLMTQGAGTAGSPNVSGQIPASLLGFMPHMSTTVGNVSYFFHKSFMTLASQQGMDVKEYDMGVDGKRATRVNLDTLFGLKQLDSKRIVKKS